jgi:hypothetical protein
VSAFVFTGPTISAEDAAAELDAVYLPPVAQGDVIRVMALRPTAIGIVDGYFEHVPAVWHKEILWALHEGVPVFGSASMGALRAAELAAFGMEGVGSIFESYMSGELEDDDEVAVAHAGAEDGFVAMSTPMVNVRSTLARAELEGVLGARGRGALEAVAKGLYYADRSWPAIFATAAANGFDEAAIDRLRAWVPGGEVDTKRADAVAMLRRMRAHAEDGSPAADVAFEFEHTEWWNHALRTAGELDSPAAAEHAAVEPERVLDEVRLTPGGYGTLKRETLVRTLAAAHARRLRMAPTAELRQAAREDLTGDGGVAAWCGENGVTETRLDELIDQEAILRWAEVMLATEVTYRGLDCLRVAGDYPRLQAQARAKQEALEAAGVADAGLDEAGLTRERLLDWFATERLGIDSPGEPAALARMAGYADPEALERALLREHLYQRIAAEA